MEEHRSLREIHRKAWMDIYKPDTGDKRRHCPICLFSTEELLDQSLAEHIAEHLEQFASRASNCKASDAGELVLQAFNASQSHQTPRYHDIQAHAPTVGLLRDKLILRTATTTAKDRIYAILGIPNTEDGAARRLKRSEAEDGNIDAKQEAAGHGSAVDTRTQQLPSIRDNPSMLDHQPDNHPEADRDLQQTQPSWHHLDLNPTFDKPYLQIPTLPTSLSEVGSPIPIWACAMATSAAPKYFSPLSHSTQSFVDGGIKDGTPISIADTETMPWLHETHPSLMTPIIIASLASLRRRRGSDYSNTSDPRTAEPPRGRQSRSPLRQDVQQRTRSPSPLWRCDMPHCRNRNFTRQADLRRHQDAHHSLQMLSKPPVRVIIHEDSRTPFHFASSASDHSRVLDLLGHRGHPTGASQENRHRSNTDTGRAGRATASSPVHELNPRTPRVKFAPSHVNQHRDLSPQENCSMWNFSRIANPMPPDGDGTLAETSLAGNRQRGVNIGSAPLGSPPDALYKQRSRKFFKCGRVFLMFWSEPAGGISTSTSRHFEASVKIYNEQAYTKIRRFVVIREGENYCHAVPITTYGGRGVAKHGVSKSDHCIVYTGRTAPSAKWDEHPRPGESGMRPIAIRVDPDSSAEELDEMSRIDLCDITRVEYNAMVASYGQVNEQSMPDLLEAFTTVWSFHAFDGVEDDDDEWVLLGDADGGQDDGNVGDRTRRIDDDKDDDDGERKDGHRDNGR